MADRNRPGQQAQQALHRANLSAVAANQARLDAAISTPAGQQVWTTLGDAVGWNDEERLVWLNAPNAWLKGKAPVDEIETSGGARLTDALIDAIEAVQ